MYKYCWTMLVQGIRNDSVWLLADNSVNLVVVDG